MNKYIGDALHTDLYQINMGMLTKMVYMKENHILMYISERFHLVEVAFAGLAKIIESM